MTDERTWVQRKRSEAECLEVLKDLDERTLVRRAQRLAMLVQIQVDWNNHLPHRSRRMLSEASACFRSEEHTSELQSRRNLVCRLLLEKKKK